MWLLCSSSISPTKKVTIFNPSLWVGQNLPWQLLVKSFARPWLHNHQRDVRAQMQRAPISTVRGTSLWTGSLVWSFASFNLCFLSLFDWTSSDLYKHKHSCVNAPWKQQIFLTKLAFPQVFIACSTQNWTRQKDTGFYRTRFYWFPDQKTLFQTR